MDNWFDELESYTPVGDMDLKEIIVSNPNILLVNADTELVGLEFNTEHLDEIFEFGGDIQFHKSDLFNVDGVDIQLLVSDKQDDLFILEKDGFIYITSVYQSEEPYLNGDVLTIPGWDYNVVINLKDMSAKTFHVR